MHSYLWGVQSEIVANLTIPDCIKLIEKHFAEWFSEIDACVLWNIQFSKIRLKIIEITIALHANTMYKFIDTCIKQKI